MQMRTQIYLKPAQHAALIKASRQLGLSLAGVIRKLVEDHILGKGEGAPSRQERKNAALALIGLGSSGLADVSENTGEHLGQAIYTDMVKEKKAKLKPSPKKSK